MLCRKTGQLIQCRDVSKDIAIHRRYQRYRYRIVSAFCMSVFHISPHIGEKMKYRSFPIFWQNFRLAWDMFMLRV